MIILLSIAYFFVWAIIGFCVSSAMGIAEALYVSILAITRLPINNLSIPMAIAIYLVITFAIFNELENKQTKIDSQPKKK